MTLKRIENNKKLLRKINVEKGYKGIPIIKKQEVDTTETSLVNFKNINYEKNKNKVVHMFLYDEYLDKIWNNYDKNLSKLREYKAIFTPDFSTYIDMPEIFIEWNVYRNRWIGAYWQSMGLKVIPTIQWAEPSTYDICLGMVEKGSIVAISTLGAKKNIEYFIWGYKEMIERIRPSKIICFGNKVEGMDEENIIFIDYKDAFSKKERERIETFFEFFEEEGK